VKEKLFCAIQYSKLMPKKIFLAGNRFAGGKNNIIQPN
jgi:hypothetical protein